MSEFRIDQIKNKAGTSGPNIAGITTFTGTSGIVMPFGPGIPDHILPGLRSSTFTAWQGLTSTRAAVTKHATIAPDGTQTADEIANADNSENYKNIYTYQNFDTSGTYIGEVFFKRVSSSTTPYVSMYIDGPSDNKSYVVFNLRDGIVETDYTDITEHSDTSKNTQYLMESVGNGWYRCAIMVKTISTTNRPFSFWPPGEDLDAVDPTNPYYTGDTTNNRIYAWHPLLYRVEPNKNISEVISNIDLRVGNTTPGAIRFNSDSMKLEYYHLGPLGIGTDTTGEWVQLTTDTPDIQTGGTRGVFGGGHSNPTAHTDMDYVNVATTGNAIDFGNLSSGRFYAAGFGSRTHGFMAGANNGSNSIERWVFASTGSSADYSDLANTRDYNPAGMSNSTRGVIAGGNRSDIEYITMSSTATGVDFGDLVSGTIQYTNGSGSSTRGIIAVGYVASPGAGVNTVEYITISTLGDSADFGDLTTTDGDGPFTCSNSVRTVRGGGGFNAGTVTIDYATIATLGNYTDFGDLTQSRYSADGVASPTRGVFGGGAAHPNYYDTIDYVQIMSTGNAVDFGNLANTDRNYLSGASNGHGGLG